MGIFSCCFGGSPTTDTEDIQAQNRVLKRVEEREKEKAKYRTGQTRVHTVTSVDESKVEKALKRNSVHDVNPQSSNGSIGAVHLSKVNVRPLSTALPQSKLHTTDKRKTQSEAGFRTKHPEISAVSIRTGQSDSARGSSLDIQALQHGESTVEVGTIGAG